MGGIEVLSFLILDSKIKEKNPEEVIEKILEFIPNKCGDENECESYC